MCREAVASQDQGFASGWNASVLLLLALVPAALGALAVAARRARCAHGSEREIDGRPRWPEGD